MLLTASSVPLMRGAGVTSWPFIHDAPQAELAARLHLFGVLLICCTVPDLPVSMQCRGRQGPVLALTSTQYLFWEMIPNALCVCKALAGAHRQIMIPVSPSLSPAGAQISAGPCQRPS